MHKKALDVRFLQKVKKTATCWEWTASRTQFGYGQINSGPRPARPILAHRLSWILHFGEIPINSCVLHKCDNPRCVNPNHLFLGDKAANYADARSKDRHSRGERHGQSKLTDDAVRNIRLDQKPDKEIAKIFGISAWTVRGVRSRKWWTHVQ